jgi:hypothetical protein
MSVRRKRLCLRKISFYIKTNLMNTVVAANVATMSSNQESKTGSSTVNARSAAKPKLFKQVKSDPL